MIILLVTTSYLPNAQNSFIINTVGSSAFSPSITTVNVGDTVTWVNTGGFHNVNGSISTFPSNPSSFINPGGVSTGWTYTYIFTIAGTYNYQCDPHLPGMIGTVIVNPYCDPYNLSTSNINTASAILSWNAIGPTSYNIKYKISGISGWNTSTVGVSTSTTNNSSQLISSLNSSTTYEWRVRPFGCSPSTNWFDGPQFTTSTACSETITQSVTAFSPNPITAYMQWSYDTLTITNTSNCDINIRPEFIISHQDSLIEQGDVTIKWFNPMLGNWPEIPYNIDANGNAYGFWSSSATDSTGVNLATGGSQQMIIRVRYTNTNNNPNASLAPYGTYSASWETFKVDSLGGNKVSLISADIVSLSLVNCATFAINSIATSNVSCAGGTDGSATVTSISNGSGNYSYLWSNGSTGSVINNLSGGNYSVIITDNSWGCIDSTSVTITEPNNLALSLNGTDISCNGSNNGTLSAIATGGSGIYKYIWNPMLTDTSYQSSLAAGLYQLTIVQIGGCPGSASANFTINEPNILTASSTSVYNTSCDSTNCNGETNITIFGGTTPYSTIWNTGDTLNSLSSICAGSYSYTILDVNACTYTNTINILNNLNIPTTSILSNANSSCDTSLCNGYITVNETSGLSQYSILWNTGDITNTLSGICGGVYSYTISDTNSCSLSSSISLIDSTTAPNFGLSATEVSCNNFLDGTAEAIILSGGGTGNISNLIYCSSSPYNDQNCNIELIRLIGDGDSIVNNTTGLADQYEDYTTQYTTITPNQNYNLEISMGVYNNPSVWSAGAKAFIDWNIDGDFDDVGEEIGIVPNMVTSNPNTTTISFTVPNYGIYGPTRLRVISQYNNDNFGPCQAAGSSTGFTPFYGATEDYSIVIAGSVPVTYLWSTGDTTSQINNLAAGTYLCTVSDTNGCFTVDSITISEPLAISTLENTTNILCNGGSNGTVTLTISGGTAPYSLNWNNTDTNNLSVGIYNYIITDINNCTFSDSISISEPIALTNSFTSTNVSCNSGADGSIDISPSGGSGPYTFSWSNGATTEDLNNISSGQYIVNITDINNCTFTDSILLTEPSALTSTSSQTNVSCAGLSDGSATVNFSGGVTDYILSWDTLTYPLFNGISVFTTPIGVPAGLYPYLLTDNNGCTHYDTIIITEPSQIISSETVVNASCFGFSDGEATLSISGGLSPYSQNWGMSNPLNLSAGIYTYTITDNNGCSINDSIIISEPDTLFVSEIITNVSCNGFSDGNAILNISGGNSPYTEDWGLFNSNALEDGNYSYIISDSNGCIYSDSITITEPNPLNTNSSITDVLCYGDSTGTATLIITGGTPGYNQNWGLNNPNFLSVGSYTYVISDSNNCTLSGSITITEPAEIATSFLNSNLTSCIVSDGSINLTVNGGSSPFTFLWNNNDSTEDISGLSAGNYFVSITDNNGCLVLDSTTITQPSNGLSLSLSTSNYNGYSISCYNGNNGSITANTIGGLGNTSFFWSTNETTQTISGYNVGSYSVTITDSIGCSLSDSIILTQPLQLTSSFTTIPASCFGLSDGGATININGGISNYNLNFNGTNYALLGGISTFNTPVGIAAGNYLYTISDTNGCTQSDTIIINQSNTLNTSLITSNYNGNNISCNGFTDGFIDIQVNGGTPPFIYYFNDTIITSTSISGLSAGTYTDSIIDANGCTYTETILLTEPAELNSIINTSNASCNQSCDGVISLNIAGGTVGYGTQWFGPNGFSGNLNTLCAGAYSVQITDNNNCILNDSVIIYEPNAININLDSLINVSIYSGNDGSLSISSNGGVGNLSYQWNGPNLFNETSQNISNLLAGVYYLTVTDSTSCSKIDSFIITQPPSLTANLDSIINIACYGACSGQIYITADGGDSVYTYLWNGPNGYSSTDEDIYNLCSGTYILELSDTTDTLIFYFDIVEPSPLSIIILSDTTICYNGSAQANAYAYGGAPPYQMIWSNGSTNTSTILNAGINSITITDSNGCLSTQNTTIQQADSITINANLLNVSCFGLQDGEVTLNITNGGTPPFLYSANNGINFQNSNTFFNLAAGTSNFTILDVNGCNNDLNVTISQPQEIISSISITNASCHGECDGIAIPSVSGGNNPYTYNWGGANPNNLCAGFYTLIITDSNGCLSTNSTIITEPIPIIVNIYQNGNYIQASTGFSAYQWLDSNGDEIIGAINDSYLPSSQGQYSVEVTDMYGCKKISNFILFTLEIIDNISENKIGIEIYPNPTNGKLIIKSSKYLTSLSLLNSIGKQIIINNKPSENINQLDLSNLAKGIYYIKLELNSQIINHKIILK